MEQLAYNLLFRWFFGLSVDAPVWDASTFSKNRDRLLEGEVAGRFLAEIVEQPRVKALMSTSIPRSTARCSRPGRARSRSDPNPDGWGEGPDDPPSPPGDPARAPGRNSERDWRGQARSNEDPCQHDLSGCLAGPQNWMASPAPSPMPGMC